MVESTELSHVDLLKAALKHSDVLIGHTNAPIGRYDLLPGGGPSDIEETHNELLARYLIYWHEFSPGLPALQRRCIWLGYRDRKPWGVVVRITQIDDPEKIADAGLQKISAEIDRLLRGRNEN